MQPKVPLRGIIKALGFTAAVFISVASVPMAAMHPAIAKRR